MLLVLHVLHVTRNTIWLVFRDQFTICSRLNVTIVTVAAGGSWRLAIDWRERLMTTRARQLPFRVSRQAVGADSLHMKRVELFTAPRFIGVDGQSGYRNLFCLPVAVR